MKPKKIKNLASVYKDIIAIKIGHKDSFKTSLNKFYGVMRKHGIKQGTWCDNGSRLISNPEWNMCYDTFKSHKVLSLDLWLSMSEPPKDLLAYGKKPKIKFHGQKK